MAWPWAMLLRAEPTCFCADATTAASIRSHVQCTLLPALLPHTIPSTPLAPSPAPGPDPSMLTPCSPLHSPALQPSWPGRGQCCSGQSPPASDSAACTSSSSSNNSKKTGAATAVPAAEHSNSSVIRMGGMGGYHTCPHTHGHRRTLRQQPC